MVVDPDHIRVAALDYYDKYWNDYWDRLYEKHDLERPGKAKKQYAEKK